MLVADDNLIALRISTALVNSELNALDLLHTPADLSALLKTHGFSGYLAGTEDEVAEIRAWRPQLRRFWRSNDPSVAALLANRLLMSAEAMPQLVHHGQSWRVELSADFDPLGNRIVAATAMGVIELIMAGELGRLRSCAGANCNAVILDLSRNRSRQFCDTGNCGNRLHVAAYRARKSAPSAANVHDDSSVVAEHS